MPQENYTLEGFNWDRSLEKLKQSSLVVGDLSDEEIARTRGVACAHVKVMDEKVAFGLSQYGKLQISSPNMDLFRRARLQLKKLIICSGWVPTALTTEKPFEKYQSIMDLSEAQEADWTKIPKAEILRLNQLFQLFTNTGFDFLLDLVRSSLKSYEKSDDSKETKSLIEKVKEWLAN